jgi:hypothetical protein
MEADSLIFFLFALLCIDGEAIRRPLAGAEGTPSRAAVRWWRLLSPPAGKAVAAQRAAAVSEH